MFNKIFMLPVRQIPCFVHCCDVVMFSRGKNAFTKILYFANQYNRKKKTIRAQLLKKQQMCDVMVRGLPKELYVNIQGILGICVWYMYVCVCTIP